MQNYWTQDGWHLLKVVAFNAAIKSGFESTAEKVIQDAIALTQRIIQFPHSGNKVTNVYGESRYWSTFNAGKIAIWKVDNDSVLFIAAHSSLPDLILV